MYVSLSLLLSSLRYKILIVQSALLFPFDSCQVSDLKEVLIIQVMFNGFLVLLETESILVV